MDTISNFYIEIAGQEYHAPQWIKDNAENIDLQQTIRILADINANIPHQPHATELLKSLILSAGVEQCEIWQS